VKPKQFNLVLSGVLAIIILAGGGGYYLATKKVSGQTDKLKQRLAAASVDDDQIDQLASLRKQYQKIEPVVAKIESALPHTKDESAIAQQLGRLAAGNGMSLSSLSFPATSGLASPTSQTAKDGDALAVPVTFQLGGSYDQMAAFLRGLEQLSRYSNVSSLNVSKVEGKAGQVTFTITLNTYLKP
jgi:Tfp pilus assembly protein PilO